MKDELTRLKRIVDKDPNSTVFVPLAEEYRKQGLLEEATETLKKGLMIQPLYTTGRVALGKVLMEREMLQEAREEFERVLDSMPENIAARKKLSELYLKLGRSDLADEHSRVVSGLTPPPSATKVRGTPSGVEAKDSDETPGDVPPAPGDRPVKGVPVQAYVDAGALESGLEAVPGDAGVEMTGDVIEIETASMADVYISQNLYDKAMDVLEKLLRQNPENKRVQQKIEDLRMLINISKRGA